MTSIDEFFGDYLKSEDIKEKGDLEVTVREVKIEKVGRGDDVEDKPIVYFVELEKGLALNRTNASAVSEVFGTKEIEQWSGKRLTLFVDPNVMFKSQRTGGIRVRVPSQGVAPQ